MAQAQMPSDIASQLILLLGETLARAQASHAKEEYGLSQIIASLKFVNHTVDAWANSSQQQDEESSQFHVHEPDLSAVSKSIDAVLDEARLVRGSSKRTAANPNKGPTSTFENAVTHTTPRKSKAAEPKKKTFERFSQALHMRPTKTVSTDDGEYYSSFSAAHEVLLRWMESRKVGWSNTHAEQRPFHIVAKQKHKKFGERSNAARKFLDSLWTIHGSPADLETEVEDAAASGGDDPSTTSTLKQVEVITRSLQRNVEELQALCKLVDQRHLHSELVSPHMAISNAVELQSADHQVSNEEASANGTQLNGIMMEHEMQAVSSLYSNLQQPLATMRLMHSIHTNIFHCHLQSVLAQCSLLRSSSQSSRRIANVLSSSHVYMCFRLAHCLVCNNGKALFSVARRVDIT